MAHSIKSSDAGISDMPKRSHRVLLLSEEVKRFNLIRKEENCMLSLLKSIVKKIYMGFGTVSGFKCLLGILDHIVQE